MSSVDVGTNIYIVYLCWICNEQLKQYFYEVNMKAKYIKNGNTIATCNMDVIPKEGDDVIIKSRALKVRKILWWIENPSNTYVQIIVE